MSYQELICYWFGLTKLPVARPIGSKVYVDERVANVARVERSSVEQCVSLVYPLCVNLEGQRTRLAVD